MKKVMFLIFCIFLVINLFGQSPRLIGMGNVNGYLADDSDIFTYPATINSYGNIAYGYLNDSDVSGDTNNFGLNYELPTAVLGLYFNKQLPSLAMDDNIILTHASLDKNFQLFFAFNDNMALRFSLAMDKYTSEDTSPEITESAMALGVGFGYSTEQLDLGVNILLPSYTNEIDNSSTTTEEKESKFIIDANARSIFSQKDNVDWVGKLDFEFGSSTYDDDVAGTDDITSSVFNISLGLAGNVNIDDNNILVLGVTPFGLLSSCSTDANDDTDTKTTMTLPAFNVGFESQICKWLVVRSGIEQGYYIISNTNETNGVEQTDSNYDSYFNYAMGLGFVYKNFNLDCVFNKDFLHNGANFITGATTSNIFGEIMLEYNF